MLVDINCSDGRQRQARIPGKWHKRVWINKDDVLLVGYSSDLTNNDKVEILHKYDEREIRQLKNKKIRFYRRL